MVCTLLAALLAGPALAQAPAHDSGNPVQSGTSYQNDTSLPLYYLPAWNGPKADEREAAENPRIPNHHVDSVDPVVQNTHAPSRQMPLPITTFDGIDATGSGCGCAPPDTDGQVGETQYVQMVNASYQIFDKATGASLAGPTHISALWAGFGGVCETGGAGDPVVLYDQLAKRWVISQFAGASGQPITDECIAVSSTSDATGTYHRYGFHLGSNFFDYPHLGVWPDGYYMAMNVFNAAGNTYLGPQPFAFDRTAMLKGNPATFVSTGIISANDSPILPANLDGQMLPALGAAEPFVEFPGDTIPVYKVFHFHADFATPSNTTFTVAGSPAAAAFTAACTSSRSCVPQQGVGDGLDGIGDRLMFRLAYRNFVDHEALVGNYTVSANSVAGVRWFELRNATTGAPTVFQEGTYQPDNTWRWMGSAAMDTMGNIAIGYSASSATLHPQLRYAGRLAGDPPGVLSQAEAHLFDGTGSQSGSGNRWGDYSDLTVDPVDDCTFWYTGEYVDSTGSWKTRIGSFKFPNCSLTPGFTLSATPAAISVCAGTPATFTVNVGSTAGYNGAVTLVASGNPAPSTTTLMPPVVSTLPGSSSLTIGNTAGVAAGLYPITVSGTAIGAAAQSATTQLSVFATTPTAPTLTAPANAATNQPARPTFAWTGSNTETYTLQIATDAAFTNIVFTQSATGTSTTPNVDLVSNTTFYWRVMPTNACGTGAASPTFAFTTAPLPGDCSKGTTAQTVYSYGFESGLSGWSSHNGGIGVNTWTDNTASVHSGAHSWQATESPTASDQRFVSPQIALPSGQLPLTLQFWTKWNLEQASGTACFDGGILEVSTDGITWTQISSASLLTDPYTGPIASNYQNPLGNLQGWCGVQDWHKSVVDIASYAGQNVQFRYRLGTDNSQGEPGWWLDDVKVQSCVASVGHTVTPGAGTNGSISPSTPVQVSDGGTTRFTVTPALGYTIGTVSGCGGSLAGNVYTTAPVTADCTVNASFNAVQPRDLGISISDGRAYAQYGAALTYTVTVSNPTLNPISSASISSVFPAQLNINQANWTCLGGPGATCTASGTGALSDSGIVVPAAGSVSWLVTAPVLPNAVGSDVVYTVNVSSAGDPNPANNTASDDDILVLFRSGFDPGNDGGNIPQQ
ncbi:hypothetical protein GCM10009105_23280 [Dokdonella soli]|uniref:DUF11 domain-containing protein n=2 Tax=Dokdonella soli TaxID=529810 RepID=A0ABP3TSE7_9GAMM